MTKEDKPTKSSELSTEDLDKVVGGTKSPGGQNDGYTATDDLFQVSGFDGGPPPGGEHGGTPILTPEQRGEEFKDGPPPGGEQGGTPILTPEQRGEEFKGRR